MEPLFLKTYGKKRRKLSAWVSPDSRKRFFDSSASTEGDSVFEPARPRRPREKTTKVTGRRGARIAKTKAELCLKENDELSSDIVPVPSSPEEPPRQIKATRVKKQRGARVQPAQRKAASSLRENSSDEENRAPPTRQSNAARKSRIASAATVLVASEEDSRVHRLSPGRFVTRRRGAALKPKVQAAIASLLNSSDDFTPGRPLGSKGRRRVSRAGNSTNTSATFSFREVSLNASDDGGLIGPRGGRIIFCSTPSVGTFGQRPHLKSVPVDGKSSSPPPLSASCAGVLSPFQGNNEDSPGQTLSANSEEKLLQELSADLFEECTRTSDGRQDSKTEDGPELSSLTRVSATDHSLEFVTADGGLECLIEALKEQCLAWPCTVPLERLDFLTTTLLSGHTTYSSCLELLCDGQSPGTGEPPAGGAAPPFSLRLSVSTHETRDGSQCAFDYESTRDTESGDHIVETHLTSNSPVDSNEERDVRLSSRCSVQLERLETEQQEPSLIWIHSSVGADAAESDSDRAGDADTTLDPARSSDTVMDGKAAVVEGNAAVVAMLKAKCLSNNVRVEVKPLTLSQIRGRKRKFPSVVSELDFDEQMENKLKPQNKLRRKDTSPKAGGGNCGSTSSEDKTSSDKEAAASSLDVRPKRGKTSVAPRERKRRSASADRPGTTRKACVSGLSVNRWKTKNGGGTHARGGDARSVDCSINELMSGRQKEPRELTSSAIKFSTPVRGGVLNLSSLLADLTPSTHTWSRLKAALSIHRKVLLTPGSCRPSGSPTRKHLADLSADLFATPFRTLLPKHLQSRCSDGSPSLQEGANLSDAEKVYAECGQTQPQPWEECIAPHRMKCCAKIGEGTFGEVFSTTNAAGDTVALKIIPVEGSDKVNGEAQKTFGEILHEIIISKELSSLKDKEGNQTHCFIGLNDLHCVRGCYPPDFMNAWDKFDRRKGSENDRPDFFESDQLFLILEFEFGGVDLENSNGKLASLGVAKSIIHQVTAALAVAEQELLFEHRDLHWGNILVKPTKQKMGSFLLNGASHSVETSGVLVRIIDYSLSRLEIDGLTVSCDISSDEELFMGEGDYQFEVYRLMRRENGNNWSDFHPRSNVLWLHYLSSKLLTMKYRSSGGRRGGGVKEARAQLARFHDDILRYDSATDALRNCPMFQ